MIGSDDATLAVPRNTLEQLLGPAALVDTAAVIALFNAIDRVADATGIPLEAEKAAATADFRSALGIGKYVEG